METNGVGTDRHDDDTGGAGRTPARDVVRQGRTRQTDRPAPGDPVSFSLRSSDVVKLGGLIVASVTIGEIVAKALWFWVVLDRMP